jgi:purine-binding chemotaxis protein CheW
MQEHVSKHAMGEKGQYLSFRLGAEDYAVDILRVQEIRGWEKVRSLPDSEDYVKGVLDLRGTIVPIIDLRVRFGESDPAYSATTVVIVMAVDLGESQQQLVGAVVDGVSDVLDIDRSDMKPPPNIGGTVSRRYLEGMVSLPRGMVILLDLDKLFDPNELAGLRDLAGD